MRRPWIYLLVAGCSHADPIVPASLPVAVARDAASAPCPVEPHTLPAGITATRVELAAHAATGGPTCLDVIHIDLARFRPRLLTATRDGSAHPAPAWRDTFHLAAAINAGMFHDDGKPVGLLVEDGTPISADNAKYAGFLAFDPRSPTDPPALITGRDCADFDLAQLRRRYRSILQAPRLLACDGAALPWADPKQYSAAAVGIARDGSLV
ncbi:MAG: hypothetical protein JO257_18710, partial [Deltaproteobacteria bacterium]|nr:hypothetical protein [Deltaproteobacteria bacterium]